MFKMSLLSDRVQFVKTNLQKGISVFFHQAQIRFDLTQHKTGLGLDTKLFSLACLFCSPIFQKTTSLVGSSNNGFVALEANLSTAVR